MEPAESLKTERCASPSVPPQDQTLRLERYQSLVDVARDRSRTWRDRYSAACKALNQSSGVSRLERDAVGVLLFDAAPDLQGAILGLFCQVNNPRFLERAKTLATSRDLEGLGAAEYLHAQDRESFERLSRGTICWCFWNAEGSVRTAAYQLLWCVSPLGCELERGVADYLIANHSDSESGWNNMPGDCDEKLRILIAVVTRSTNLDLTLWGIDQMSNQIAMDPDEVTKELSLTTLRRLACSDNPGLRERAKRVLSRLDDQDK